MGFEHWEVGFRKKMGWEMGLVPPLQDPHCMVTLSVSGALGYEKCFVSKGYYNIQTYLPFLL